MSARGYFAERARLSGEGRACPRDMTCQRPINHKGKCDASDPPVSGRKPSAAPVFHPGDVVLDPGGSTPTTPGIVIEASARSVTVVWANGGRSGGPGLLRCLAHREPRLIVAVTPGMMGNRGWNREQAVKAALRLARIEVDDNGAERATPTGREAARRAP